MARVRSFWVRAAGEDGEGSIELFSEHDAGEFVRVSHGAEREFLRHALTERSGEAIGVTAHENHLARSAVAPLAKPFREGFGIVLFAVRVEEECGGGAVGVKFLDGGIGVAHFGDFDGAGM